MIFIFIFINFKIAPASCRYLIYSMLEAISGRNVVGDADLPYTDKDLKG